MTLEDVQNTQITDASNIPPLVPTIHVKDTVFAVQGDISFIAGQAKSGKSTLCRSIIATALMPTVSNDFDSLGIRAAYCEGRPVIYIDTEQTRASTDKMRTELKRTLGIKELPDNLIIYNWRQFDYKENREAIDLLFKRYKDAAYWIVDGVTDLIPSANDEEKSNELIRHLMKQADTLGTTVVLLMHENYSNGKLRGHIGSEAERKCGGAISISKDREKGIHWIATKLVRGSADFDRYAFQFDKDQDRFVTLPDGVTRGLRGQLDKKESRLAELHQWAKQVYDGRKRISKTELLTGLKDLVPQTATQTPDAHRKAIERIVGEMIDKHNVVTPMDEPKGILRYLPLPDSPELSDRFIEISMT